VTEADERAETLILAWLHSAYPALPVIAEEATAKGAEAAADLSTFVLVDPLDGTKEFIHGRDDFTVNIALIEQGAPVSGVVYAPATGQMYVGAVGAGAFMGDIVAGADVELSGLRAICVRAPPADGLVAVVSRSHANAETAQFLKGFPIAAEVATGSSLKFCLLAEGKADLYPRLGSTMQWDTAAGHAVLTAAGGRVTCTDGAALRYGHGPNGFLNPGFVGWGGGA
jgi:3'(2'),5'-bisphosphate nucleotidase